MSETKILTYMGKPLVRQGQYLFYGDPEDKVILFMNILETKKDGELDVASKVLVQIQSTDDSLGFNEKVIKQCEKKSFYEAFYFFIETDNFVKSFSISSL